MHAREVLRSRQPLQDLQPIDRTDPIRSAAADTEAIETRCGRCPVSTAPPCGYALQRTRRRDTCKAAAGRDGGRKRNATEGRKPGAAATTCRRTDEVGAGSEATAHLASDERAVARRVLDDDPSGGLGTRARSGGGADDVHARERVADPACAIPMWAAVSPVPVQMWQR